MNRQQTLLAAQGITDENDRLLSADGPLAQLQESCGGVIPGVLAIPELLALVRQARHSGLRIAREFSAFDGEDMVSGFARVHPLDDEEGAGCEVLVENWHRTLPTKASSHEQAEWQDAVDRATCEVSARLDAAQRVQLISVAAADASELQEMFDATPGKLWSDYVELQDLAHKQPLHWRLLDGCKCRIPGSHRHWRARLIPIDATGASPRGFELLLVADEPLVAGVSSPIEVEEPAHSRLIGSALTPVLRQPIARIIANAETIRTRLAGPIKAEYSEYAGSIAAAGQHLSSMLDDLADLEVVEAPGFKTARDHVDLADAARRAAGILGVRARNRGISIVLPNPGEPVIADGEFRRVLQILINLIGNAIAYSPENSTVTVAVDDGERETVSISVRDEGPGVDPDQAKRIFEKFERLGRDSDGGNDSGSGLGLYISRKLALAMGGNLEVVEQGGKRQGAEFRLTLARVND